MQSSVRPNDCVLVVDDDVVMRELLTLLLEAEGRSVLSAESGDEALLLLANLTAQEFPSVVLTDLKMPGMPPAMLGKRLRAVCAKSTVLVAMSGSTPTGGAAKSFDAFLMKPFTVAELDTVLGTAAGRPGSTVDIAASGGDDSETAGQLPALDEVIYAKLLSMMGPKQLPELFSLFLSDAPDRIARMQSAVVVKDGAAFSREAHAIKGGCGMLGATEIHFLAGEMEAGGLACSPLLADFQRGFERLRRILEERKMVI